MTGVTEKHIACDRAQLDKDLETYKAQYQELMLLVEEGIESLSLNPDTVVDTWIYLSRQAANRVGKAT